MKRNKHNKHNDQDQTKSVTLAELEIDAKLTRHISGGESTKNKTEKTTM